MTYEYCMGPDGAPVKNMVRRSDGAFIPADPANVDWQDYQAWLKAGHKPAEPAPSSTIEAGAEV